MAASHGTRFARNENCGRLTSRGLLISPVGCLFCSFSVVNRGVLTAIYSAQFQVASILEWDDQEIYQFILGNGTILDMGIGTSN